MSADVLGDADPVLVGVGEAELEGAEEARTAGDAYSHEPEFAQHLLPLADADALQALEGREYGEETLLAVVRELEGSQDCVDDSAQDELACGPGAVPFQELLDGGRLVAGLPLARLVQNLVDGMENGAPEVPDLAAGALRNPDEVVDEDIDLSEGCLPRSVRRSGQGRCQRWHHSSGG